LAGSGATGGTARLFGLSNSEGNHGEDVKEYYFYVDNTPTYSYMKDLYKHPQAEYPYPQIIEANRTRDKQAAEYELLDTGIFDADKYFDIFVEYAKAEPEDILIQITVCNQGPEPAEIHSEANRRPNRRKYFITRLPDRVRDMRAEDGIDCARGPTPWRDRAARDELYVAGPHRPGAGDAAVLGAMGPS
jgi:hypothetical protein